MKAITHDIVVYIDREDPFGGFGMMEAHHFVEVKAFAVVESFIRS